MPEMDNLVRWLTLGLCFVNLGATALIWWVGKTLVSREEYWGHLQSEQAESYKCAVDRSNISAALDIRLARLEQAATTAYGWQAHDDLVDRVANLMAEVKATTAKLQGFDTVLARTEHAVEALNRHLLERGL